VEHLHTLEPLRAGRCWTLLQRWCYVFSVIQCSGMFTRRMNSKEVDYYSLLVTQSMAALLFQDRHCRFVS